MTKTILTVAPTGAWPTKQDTPYIPITPAEIADDVFACWEAGASIAHLHVRDDDGKASMRFDAFEEAVGLIRDRCDIVLNLTTSGALDATDEERIRPFRELRPEFASFDCGSMNWAHSTVFLNSPPFLEKLGAEMTASGVRPEIEIFDAGMVYNAIHYIERGLIAHPAHFQFVLGAPGGVAATVENLVYLKSLLPQGSTWSAFGIGRMHLPILYASLALGGNIRVGMEDNIYYSRGRLATSNAEFVARALRIVEELGGQVATPDETRALLALDSSAVVK